MLVTVNLWCSVSAAALMAGLGDNLNWSMVNIWVPTTTSNNLEGCTVRVRIAPGTLAVSASHIRLHFAASSSGLEVDSCHIGYGATAGDNYDFFDAPQRVTFDGADSFILGADETIRSSGVEMTFDPERPLIVAFHITDGSTADDVAALAANTGWTTFIKDTGATDDSATVDATGYSTDTNASLAVTQIDMVLTGAATETTITIPATSVTENLTNFPVRVNLADMSTEFWEGVSSDGGNIRVRTALDVDLPIDLVTIDPGTLTGELFFKAPALSISTSTSFKIVTVAGALAPGHATSNGRNAVWSDYEAVYMFTSLENRTGVSTRDASMVGTAGSYPFSPVGTGPDINVHQGIAWDGTHFYAIDTLRVYKYTSSWVAVGSPFLLSSIGTPDVNHFGDGTIHDGELFIVYEKYPNSTYNNQHVAVLDPATMTLLRTYDISAQGHEVSSICWDATNNYFVITNYLNSTLLYKYDEDFNYLGTITTTNTARKQGIEYYGGYFWVTTGDKTFYRFNLDGSGRSLQWDGDIDGYMEGIAAKGDGTFFILFDGGLSAIYNFAPAGSAGIPGWLNIDGNGNALAGGMAQLTTWTMGASIAPLNVGSNGAILSYTPPVSSNNFRASLVLRGSNSQYGIWNSTNTWLQATHAAPTIGTRHRLHETQEAATSRKIWVNGEMSATGSTAQRPGNSGGTWSLFIGAEDTSYFERMIGSINYVYLRNGLLSAGWLAAEYKSWETETFYTL